MEEVIDSAREALQVYLWRGQRALAATRSGSLDTALKIAASRRYPFLRFQVAAAKAERYGLDLRAEASLAELGNAITALDRELTAALERDRLALTEDMSHLSAVRQVMKKYHSGGREQTGFRSTI